MPINVVALDGDTRCWDDLVRASPESSFCHLSAWREILSGVLGAECLYRIAVDDAGVWQGLLPLVRVRSRIFGHYLVSMPFLNEGGPIGSSVAQQRLVDAAVSEARRTKADLLELRTRHDAELELPASSRKVTVLLPLDANPAARFARFPAKLRSQIRRPVKEGLVAQFGPEQLHPFYDVFARTMRDLGTPVLPRAFFERISRAFPELVRFGVVYRGTEPVAGGCGFLWREEFEITWAGALRSSRSISANMLLYWALMEHVMLQGARVFNFGRCTPDGGTHRFKKQWGGMDVALPWRQFTAPESARGAPPSPDDRAFSWGPKLWRRLPLPLANLMGPRLVRFLP